MKERKIKQVMVSLEPTFYDAMVRLLSISDNSSMSSYVRSLILNDLIIKGIITDSIIQEVLIG